MDDFMDVLHNHIIAGDCNIIKNLKCLLNFRIKFIINNKSIYIKTLKVFNDDIDSFINNQIVNEVFLWNLFLIRYLNS